MKRKSFAIYLIIWDYSTFNLHILFYTWAFSGIFGEILLLRRKRVLQSFRFEFIQPQIADLPHVLLHY